MALKKDGDVIPEVSLNTLKENKQNKGAKKTVETKKKTTTKEPVKKDENNFQKAEENLTNNTKEKSQNTGNQGVSDFADFLSIETENDEKQTVETMHKNPPLPEVEGFENDTENDSLEDESSKDFDLVDSEEMDMFSDDLNGGELFDDEELVSEFIIEILDTGMSFGASFVAKDVGNTDKWALSDKRKKKLQKPLIKLLANKQVKMKPEYAFIGLLLSFYAPTFIKAFGERQDKKKQEQKTANMSMAQRNAISATENQDTGRKAKCTVCKKEIGSATDNCDCPTGPTLSPYMKKKLKGEI